MGGSVNRVRSMTEHDRSHRERTLTSDSYTSDKTRPRSFTEADKHIERISLKKPLITAHASQTASEDAAVTDKKVVVVGKCCLYILMKLLQ